MLKFCRSRSHISYGSGRGWEVPAVKLRVLMLWDHGWHHTSCADVRLVPFVMVPAVKLRVLMLWVHDRLHTSCAEVLFVLFKFYFKTKSVSEARKLNARILGTYACGLWAQPAAGFKLSVLKFWGRLYVPERSLRAGPPHGRRQLWTFMQRGFESISEACLSSLQGLPQFTANAFTA